MMRSPLGVRIWPRSPRTTATSPRRRRLKRGRAWTSPAPCRNPA